MDQQDTPFTVEAFATLWQEEQNDRPEQEKFWNFRSTRYNQHVKRTKEDPNWDKLYAWLSDLGGIQPSFNVLDIGCGPGKFAVNFAKRDHAVTALDISEGMLEKAKANSSEAGVAQQIQFIHAPWEQLTPADLGSDGFDLVFASKTPGISSLEAIAKMNQVSRHGCFYSNFVYKRNPLQNRLRSLLGLPEKTYREGDAVYATFNVLWLEGYYPALQYLDRDWEIEWQLDEAIEYFTLYFEAEQEHPLSVDQQNRLQLALQQDAAQHQGVVLEQVQSKLAWMYWNVKR